jgi:hypothetical protein
MAYTEIPHTRLCKKAFQFVRNTMSNPKIVRGMGWDHGHFADRLREVLGNRFTRIVGSDRLVAELGSEMLDYSGNYGSEKLLEKYGDVLALFVGHPNTTLSTSLLGMDYAFFPHEQCVQLRRSYKWSPTE